ncbi:MAG: lipid-A-disaccharide synthase [Saprospiraceae bacterium]|nr:lipid-A-disaccharide synthase [Saprospiraceae bacterium]
MKYYLIAGEASGDLHGANLMRRLQAADKDFEFRFWGGEKMQSVGGSLVQHYRNTAFMGFWEVIKNLKTILNFIKQCKDDIKFFQPDVIVLIDYPGFNLRIAKWAKNQGFKVVYYITPQVWAWHKSRVHDLGKYTDKLLVILPFEKAFFAKYGYEASYTGHPLLDAIAQFTPDPTFKSRYHIDKDVIALLPGSRKQEINLILPEMLRAVVHRAEAIVIAGAPSISDAMYEEILAKENMQKKVTLVRNETYDILSIAKFALVGSGTATLETALFKVPQIVCYKGSKFSYMIAKKLVDVKYISLVNLIADKEIVKELIQENLNEENIKNELELLDNNSAQMIDDYSKLIIKLGSDGASERAAQSIFQLIQSS